MKLLCGTLAVVCSALSACDDRHNISEPVLLIEHDGIKIYRFYDDGHPIYYTDTRGRTQWHSGGKGGSDREVEGRGFE